jgi:uncharacterized protein
MMAKAPLVTGLYLGLLGLIYLVLTVMVIRYRRSGKVAFGDGNDIALRSAIRAHAHFGEYVPIAIMMIAFIEMSGSAIWIVHGLAVMLIAGRLMHPFGMFAKPSEPAFNGRVFGTALTITVVALASITLLWRGMAG